MREIIEIELGEGQTTAAAATVARGLGKGRRVRVNRAESVLSWLRSRALINARQHEAGERLRHDYERAALAPRVTMRWEAVRLQGAVGGEPNAAQLDAKRRFDEAMHLVGPGLRDILWRTVCANEGLNEAERALGWPARSGRLVLGLALDRLADAYQLA